MKLFVAVVIFVVVSSALADDPVQGLAPSPQVKSNSPKNQSQSNHENPGYVALTTKAPIGDPDTGHEPPEGGKENDRKPLWIAVIALFVSFGSFGTALAGLLQTNKSRKITERAYLAAETWEIKGDYLVCNVTNKGRTPAPPCCQPRS
jgi:hypothetical protein